MNLNLGTELIWTLTGQHVRVRGSVIPSRTPGLEAIPCVWEETTPNGVPHRVTRALYLEHLKPCNGEPPH